MKNILLTFFLTFAAVFFISSPAAASDPLKNACESAGGTQSPVCQQRATQNKKTTNPLVQTIYAAASVIAGIAGIAAVVVIIISGFNFVTAGGIAGGQRAGDNPGGAKKARQTLVGALVGLLVVALAWTLITFVLNLLT